MYVFDCISMFKLPTSLRTKYYNDHHDGAWSFPLQLGSMVSGVRPFCCRSLATEWSDLGSLAPWQEKRFVHKKMFQARWIQLINCASRSSQNQLQATTKVIQINREKEALDRPSPNCLCPWNPTSFLPAPLLKPGRCRSRWNRLAAQL